MSTSRKRPHNDEMQSNAKRIRLEEVESNGGGVQKNVATNTKNLLQILGITDLPQSSLLPFLTCSEQTKLMTCRTLSPMITAFLPDILKEIMACLLNSEAKEEIPTPQQIQKIGLILNNVPIPFYEKCKQIFSCLDRELSCYFKNILQLLNENKIDLDRVMLCNDQRFRLINLFLKNPALTRALTITNQALAEKALSLVSLLGTLVRVKTNTRIGAKVTTAIIIERNNKKYILTTAHGVDEGISYEITLANAIQKTYVAEKIHVSNQCDLALLQVSDPEFNRIAKPASFGGMVKLNDRIKVVDCHLSRETYVSFSSVSSILVDTYVASGLDMLRVQFAHFFGIYGGPVLSGSQVVGIFFQGTSLGFNSFIPIPVIERYLTEVFSHNKYQGFPMLPIEYECQEDDKANGVRILSIDDEDEPDAYKKLKVGDVLLEIESLPISNEGMVNVPNLGKVDFCHLTHMKFIGDSVNLKVERYDAEAKGSVINEINVTLDSIPLPIEDDDIYLSMEAGDGSIQTIRTKKVLTEAPSLSEEFFGRGSGCAR